MAIRKFALNTEPHVAEVGDTELKFVPEVAGDEFLDAYTELRDGQQNGGVDLDTLSGADAAAARRTLRAVRVFLARLMMPESAELFLKLDVVDSAGSHLASFDDLAEAEAFASEGEGRRVTDALRLPQRVIVELMEWVVELYGGGAGERPTGSSGGSARQPRPSGTPGRGASR